MASIHQENSETSLTEYYAAIKKASLSRTFNKRGNVNRKQFCLKCINTFHFYTGRKKPQRMFRKVTAGYLWATGKYILLLSATKEALLDHSSFFCPGPF